MSGGFMMKSVLVIDDNDIDRFVHKKLIEHHKIALKVIESESGRDALEKLIELSETGEVPDLILLDLMMPEMDGFQFLTHYDRLVTKFSKTPKLFMVSSTEDDNDLHRSKQNKHILKLLHKPLFPNSLIEGIKIHS